MTEPKSPKFEVMNDVEDIAGCDMIVCALAPDGEPLILPDNKMGFCSKCDQKVQYRPYMPPGPALVCHACALPALEAEIAKGEEITIATSSKALAEVVEYVRNKRKE